MSAVVTSTTTEPTSTSTLTSEINTGASIAAGVAAVIPGGAPVALGIGAAAAIADLIVHMTSMYGKKVITAAQLNTMVATAVSGYDASVKAWEAAP